jgi:hemerythrin-like domain-containing protein
MVPDLFASPSAGFDQPFAMLHACHERVQRSLALLGRLVDHLPARGADASAADAAHDVLRYFDLAAPHHHEDEERHVFPRLAQDPQLAEAVARLRADHLEIDRLWQALRPHLEAVAARSVEWDLSALRSAAQAFIAIHDAHVATEENLIFPAAEAAVRREGEQALAAIGEEMAKRRGARFRPG